MSEDPLVKLVEKAIQEHANKATPAEVVEGMFKGALAAALAQRLEKGGRIPSAYIEKVKRMLISCFQEVSGDFDKSNKYFENLFKFAMKEILLFSDQQHAKEIKVQERPVTKEIMFRHNMVTRPDGLIIPDEGK